MFFLLHLRFDNAQKTICAVTEIIYHGAVYEAGMRFEISTGWEFYCNSRISESGFVGRIDKGKQHGKSHQTYRKI